MFKESDDNPQLDIFSSPTEYLRGSKMKKYFKNDSLYNLFGKHVVMRVDEPMFSVLFSDGQGAPNASIRILVGMMILKEGHGWSDAQLFMNCGFNLLVRSALGLTSLEDAEPVPSTYYLFRRKLVDYQKENGVNLMKECLSRITVGQALEFGVEGRRVRMDRKLVGSNIARYSRYELVHETFRQFITCNKVQYVYYCKHIIHQQKQSKLSGETALFSNLKKRGFQSGHMVVLSLSTESQVCLKLFILNGNFTINFNCSEDSPMNKHCLKRYSVPKGNSLRFYQSTGNLPHFSSAGPHPFVS